MTTIQSSATVPPHLGSFVDRQIEAALLRRASPIDDKGADSDSSGGSRTPQRRLLQDHWFEQFPWLELDREQNLFFCRFCVSTGKENVFTKGKPLENPKKDHFVKHQSCGEHLKAEIDYAHAKSAVDSLPLTPNTNDSGSESQTDSPAPKRRRQEPSQTSPAKLQQNQLAAQLFAMQTDPAFLMQQYVAALYGLQSGLSLPSPMAVKKEEKTRMRGSSNKDGKRRFQEYWFDQFPWLKLDPGTQLFFCKYCRDTGRNNSFAEGKKIVKNPKKHHFVQHQMTADHQGAVAALGLPPDNIKNIVKKRNTDKSFTSLIHQKPSVLNTPTPSPPPTQVPLDLTNVRPSSEELLISWKKEFSWLQPVAGRNAVVCIICKQFAPATSTSAWCKFVTVPSSKDSLYSHENSEEHQQAVQTASYPSFFKRQFNSTLISDCGSDTDSVQSNDFEGHRQRAHSRKTISKWLKAYSWLRHHAEKDLYTCSVCKEGEWAKGIEAFRIERENIVRHDEEEVHRNQKISLKKKNSILDDLLALKSACQSSESLPRVDWFMEFNWLQLSPGSILHCRFCKNAEEQNVEDDLSGTGLPLDSADRITFEIHEQSDLHKTLIGLKAESSYEDLPDSAIC